MTREMLVGFAALVLLSACGGGGSMSSSDMMVSGTTAMTTLQSAPAPAEPFNVPPTMLGATVNGMSYTLTYSDTPNSGMTLFNNQSANSNTVTVTVQQGTTTLASDSTTDYYLLSPFTPLGMAGTLSGTLAGTTYTLTLNSVNPLPSMLMVGASGTLFSGSFMASGNSTVSGTLTETYSVTAGTADALTLTIESDSTINGQMDTSTTVFSVDMMGHLTLQSVEVMVNGQAVTFTVPMSTSSMSSMSTG